ncbi:MAG TPA: hypothetical protein VFA90_13455 [Terriglobales bacterium]|nr:hypothetical protein [Terriglobales bacterium]
MSVGAQIWKHIASRPGLVPGHEVAKPATAQVVNSVPEPGLSLVHQLFFPATGRRTAILFAAVDAGSRASGLCEQVGIALSIYSGEMVGIVDSSANTEIPTLRKKPASVGRSIWQTCTVPVAERVRRFPASLICDNESPGNAPTRGGLEQLQGAFSYFLLSSSIADSELPLLCRMCDAAVLVLTANVTRKQAALRAKEQLVRYGVNVLGAVLDQRKLSIPESIYRRL